MSSFNCPFCGVTMSVTSDTHKTRYPSFERSDGYIPLPGGSSLDESCIAIDFYRCPNCNKYTIIASEKGKYTKKLHTSLIPISQAKQFPDYIPEAIRKDYEEAYAILNLSPKASATLSRRCLQGMIRDFHGIIKSRLIDEVNELQSIVPATQWKAIDAIRSVGNIGAHMEKDINTIIDVDSGEAEKLLKLIELLMNKWYISRHDEEELLLEIDAIANAKKSQKNSNTPQ